MFNEGLFKKQQKLFKQNNKEDIDIKYDILNTIELYNKENIYNINMIIDSEEEAEDFVRRVEVPDEEWKTLTDVIIDVRKEKLGQADGIKAEYIEELIAKNDYIGLHKEIEGIFLHKIIFIKIKDFLIKIDKFGIDKVFEIINIYKTRGYSTTMCMINEK